MKKLVFSFCAILILNITVSAYSQEEALPQDSPSQESSIQETQDIQGQKLIKKVEVKGDKAISTATILSKIKTRINQCIFLG